MNAQMPVGTPCHALRWRLEHTMHHTCTNAHLDETPGAMLRMTLVGLACHAMMGMRKRHIGEHQSIWDVIAVHPAGCHLRPYSNSRLRQKV